MKNIRIIIQLIAFIGIIATCGGYEAEMFGLLGMVSRIAIFICIMFITIL